MPVSARDPSSENTLTTHQDAAAATADGTAADVRGYGALVVHITGTFVGTVTFEATVDDTVWVAVGLKTAADGAAVTTATAPGLFKAPPDLLAVSQFRARVSAYTSGAITVVSRKAVAR